MEVWELYDREGNPTGRRICRGEPIPAGYRYLAAEVWITDGAGRLLIQQRSLAKKAFPGRWGMTTGCMVAGEGSRQGAAREVAEELGIAVEPRELEFWRRFVREEAIWDVYRLCRPAALEDLRLQQEEVLQADWETPAQIRERAAKGEMVEYPEFLALLAQAEKEWLP